MHSCNFGIAGDRTEDGSESSSSLISGIGSNDGFAGFEITNNTKVTVQIQTNTNLQQMNFLQVRVESLFSVHFSLQEFRAQ